MSGDNPNYGMIEKGQNTEKRPRYSSKRIPANANVINSQGMKFTSLHDSLAVKMNRFQHGAHLPNLMNIYKNSLFQKDPNKRTAPNNNRPIICLHMMWKILTEKKSEEIYYSLTTCKLFPEEQKRCTKVSRGTAELVYIDKYILNKRRSRRKNLAMAWIDYKKDIRRYRSSKLDYKLPRNTQNIIWSHKYTQKKGSWIQT